MHVTESAPSAVAGVSEESVSTLAAMGFSEKQAQAALKVSSWRDGDFLPFGPFLLFACSASANIVQSSCDWGALVCCHCTGRRPSEQSVRSFSEEAGLLCVCAAVVTWSVPWIGCSAMPLEKHIHILH